jgi:hypothetical protein
VSKSGFQVFLDGNLPVVVGECPKCKNGDRGMVLVDYVHNPVNEHRSTVYIKSIACFSVYQTNISEVAED